LKQKETILKLGNPLKSKSKFTKSKIGLGASTSTLSIVISEKDVTWFCHFSGQR
jgi:hypothetical protein